MLAGYGTATIGVAGNLSEPFKVLALSWITSQRCLHHRDFMSHPHPDKFRTTLGEYALIMCFLQAPTPSTGPWTDFPGGQPRAAKVRQRDRFGGEELAIRFGSPRLPTHRKAGA